MVAGASPASATTWGEKERACPLCEQTETFFAPMSSGSYIYRWPSRLQFVFWPATETRAVYSCTGCKFTAFMWDYQEPLPAEQRAALRKVVAGLSLEVAPADPKDEAPPLPYLRIPALQKLAAAEQVYRALGKKSDAEWSHFYRAWTYQALAEKDPEVAASAAKKCVEVTERLLADEARAGKAKETHTILGAMFRVLADWPRARAELAKAKALTYTDPQDPRNAQGINAFLDELVADLEKLVAEESRAKSADETPEKTEKTGPEAPAKGDKARK